MVSYPPLEPAENTHDLGSVVAALHDRSGPLPVTVATAKVCERSARSNRRAGLGLVLAALLVGGVFALLSATPRDGETPSGDSRAGVVFANAESGTCLNWPPDAPDKPSFVQCRDDHVFEVAKSVEMTNFGEPCQAAVRQYLGARYDPNSRFTISVLWAGDAAGDATGHRNLLCGLELLGAQGKPVPFQGRVATLDQSRVWPAGTCLGIDGNTRRSTDLPVDCVTAHAIEVTGAVNLADRFAGAAPNAAEQDIVLRDECTRIAEAYLAPNPLQSNGLRIEFGTIATASWDAGSRQMACGLGSVTEQGLNPLVGSVRGAAVGDQAVARPQAPPPPGPVAPQSSSTPSPTPTSSPSSTSSPSPSPSSSSPTSSSPTSSPSPTTSSSAPSTSSPSPSPTSETSETRSPQPGVLELPGLAPITLPGAAPPPPGE